MSILESYIKCIYKIWSKIYDNLIDKEFEFNRNEVIKELKIKNNDKILEVGVGTGLNLKYYPKNCNLTAIDISKDMIEKAKKKKFSAKVKFDLVNMNNLPYKDNSFDKAIATYAIRVSINPKKALQEISRAVKNKGLLVIVDEFEEKNFIRSLLKTIILLLGWGRDYKVEDLIKDTYYKIIKDKRISKVSNTKLVILENNKFLNKISRGSTL